MEQALQIHSTERQKPGVKSHGTPSGTTHGSACDQCHRRKEKCSGRIPCDRCNASNNVCTYSLGRPLGKPKGRRNNVNTRNSTIPAQHNPASSLMAGDCISKKASEIPEGMELDACDETIIFGGMTDEKPPQPVVPNSNPNTSNASGLFSTDTLGTFPFIFDGTSQHGLPLTSQDTSETTGELRHFASALGVWGNINDMPTPQRNHPFSPTTQSWPGSGIGTAVSQNVSGMLRRDFPLDIIAALYSQQKSISWAPIGETLLIAREGLDAVSQYISDLSSMTTPASISSTVALASLLILQQALACYTELRVQAAARFERGKNGESDSLETLYIGEFQIRGSESCKSVLEALVKAEVSRGHVILARLQQVAEELHKVGDDKTGLLEVAFRRGSTS